MEDLETIKTNNDRYSHTTAENSQVLQENSQVLPVCLMLVLSVAITSGNVISLLVFVGSRRFHTPQGYLKTSLATADLAVGVLVIPYSVYKEMEVLLKVGSGPVNGAPPVELDAQGFGPCYLVGPIFAGCTLVSVCTIFLLSVERNITVLRPLHKNIVVTKHRTLVLIVLSWLFCFALAVSPLLLSADVDLEYNTCSKMCNYALSPGGWRQHSQNQSTRGGGGRIMLLFPTFDFSLLGATALVNLVTFFAVRKFSRARKNVLTRAQRAHTGPAFTDLRAAKTILILTAFFSASVAPVAVLVVLNVLGLDWCWFSLYAFWILACSSAWNVLIYGARDRLFRQRLREMFLGRRGVCKRPGGARGARRTPTARESQGCGPAVRHAMASKLTLGLTPREPHYHGPQTGGVDGTWSSDATAPSGQKTKQRNTMLTKTVL